MPIRILLMVALPLSMLLGGCVMKSAYDAKVQEAQQLNHDLEQTQGELDKLKAGYDELETASTTQKNLVQRLENDLANVRKTLEESVRPENLLRSLADTLNNMKKEIEALTAENAELKAKEAANGNPGVDPSPVMEVAPVVHATDEPAVEPMSPEPSGEQPAAADTPQTPHAEDAPGSIIPPPEEPLGGEQEPLPVPAN